MTSKSKSSTEFLWEVLSRSLGLDQRYPSPTLAGSSKHVEAPGRVANILRVPNGTTTESDSSKPGSSNSKRNCSKSSSPMSRIRATLGIRQCKSTRDSRNGSHGHSKKSRSSKKGSPQALSAHKARKPRQTKVQFSKSSSECILSPGIVRNTFSKPDRKEQRKLRRLAERGRLYMQKHGKELPEEYFDRTPTSLVSELDRRERERKSVKR